jgi:hypothetical protein
MTNGPTTPGQTPPSPYAVALMQAHDPRSLQLADLMRQLGQQPITSPGQLGTNLLADALLQYGYNRRQKALQASPVGAPNGPPPPLSPPPPPPSPLATPISAPGLQQA